MDSPASGPVRARAILGSIAFSWLSFAAMTVMAVWNEGRPGTPLRDPVLSATPYVAWLSDWNYWIWLLAWISSLALVFARAPAVFVRLMIASGLASLLRGVCILATGLAPPSGFDPNAALAWDWALRFDVVLQILNPVSVFLEDSAHVWLTKDLFFSGHTSSTFLVVLFGWPLGRVRWFFVVAHAVVVASVLFGHVHYAIDVAGGWVAAVLAFLATQRVAGRLRARETLVYTPTA
jgi:membrane-associated phospholipid phosphatase